MAWGLKIRGMGKQQIAERVKKRRAFWSWTVCSNVARASFRRSAPACGDGPRDCARSGGVLFDEPLSNLDAKLRVQMRLDCNSCTVA